MGSKSSRISPRHHTVIVGLPIFCHPKRPPRQCHLPGGCGRSFASKGPTLSNASRFKLHDVLANDCCAPSCEAPASKRFASTIPLCERHLLRVYKAVNRQLRAESAINDKYRLLPAREVVGPCPACGLSGYLGLSDTNVVSCRNSGCFYSADARKFELVRRQAMFSVAGRQSVVYYAGFQGLIKIGTSANLKNRWSAIQAESLLGFEYGDRNLEIARHQQFDAYHSHGEWFDNNAVLRAHINEVCVTS